MRGYKLVNKIAIITDSTTDIYQEDLQKNENIFVVPMHITYNDGREFRDGVDITSSQIIKDLDEFRPKTASPLGENFVKTFKEIKEAGYTHVAGVFLSEGISGTYASAIEFAKLFEEDNFKIQILPTKGVSMIIGHPALEMAKTARETGDFVQTVSLGKQLLQRTCVYFAVESLKYLILGGRISKVEGTIAEMLDIKPIVGVNPEDGTLSSVGKVRGRKRSIKKVLELFVEEIGTQEVDKIFVVHGERMEDAKYLQELFEQEYPNAETEIHSLSALLTVHTGPGTIGAAIFLK